MPHSLLCWFHDPDYESERAEARSRGGLGREARKSKPRIDYSIPPTTLEAIVHMSAQLASDVLMKKITLAQASAVRAILGLTLRALEAKDLDARVSALEKGNNISND